MLFCPEMILRLAANAGCFLGFDSWEGMWSSGWLRPG